MLRRFAALLLVSISAACLVAGVASCGAAGDARTDAAGGSDRPRSSGSGGSGGSGGSASETHSAAGGGAGGMSSGGSSAGGSGGQSKTGGSGGVSASSSSARPGGRGPDAGSTGRPADASVVDAPAGREAGPSACDDKTSNNRLAIYYYTGNSTAQTQDIAVHLAVLNFTALTARLSQVTVRYWFTDEDAGSPNMLLMNYTPPTVSKITTRFLPATPTRVGADTVLEISFTPNPDAGVSFAETKEFNFNFHKNDYDGTYNLANDYSYDASLSKGFGPNPKITAYIAGELAWGCEPPIAYDAGSDSMTEHDSR